VSTKTYSDFESDLAPSHVSDLGTQPWERVTALRRYITILRRRRWLVAAALLLPVLAAILFSLHETKSYGGLAQVQISRQNLANALTGTPDSVASTVDFTTIVQTQAYVARSPQLADRVIAAVPAARLSRSEFLADSAVTPIQNSDLLQFEVVNPKPALAVALTNEYASQFTSYRSQLDTSSLSAALRQVDNAIVAAHGHPAVLTDLLAKQQQLTTLQTLQTANAQVIASAVMAQQVAPQLKRNVILGIVAGLLLALGAVVVAEQLDTRVRSTEELESRLRYPLLGRLPPPPANVTGPSRVMMVEDSRRAEAEAFRIMRINLQFSWLDRNVKTIMVMSAVESEGKSTTASNLAATFALSGERVVVVDLDLRRPTQHKLFGLDQGPGLTDVVLKRTSLSDALVEISLKRDSDGQNGSSSSGLAGGLHILRAGSLPPDPGEFVLLPSVREILHALRDDFDLVVVDSPPVLQTGDAMNLTERMDGVVVLARLGAIRRHALDELSRSLASSSAPVLGVVITGDRATYAYGYGGGYGYGYAAASSA
jgi:succinoglycan biosynthesis transport protein ExoP